MYLVIRRPFQQCWWCGNLALKFSNLETKFPRFPSSFLEHELWCHRKLGALGGSGTNWTADKGISSKLVEYPILLLWIITTSFCDFIHCTIMKCNFQLLLVGVNCLLSSLFVGRSGAGVGSVQCTDGNYYDRSKNRHVSCAECKNGFEDCFSCCKKSTGYQGMWRWRFST